MKGKDVCPFYAKPVVATQDCECNDCPDIGGCAYRAGIVRSFNPNYDDRPSE